mgnify:CR=1 FL=1
MTSFQIAKLRGADPQDPSFKELEKAAVKGLEERPHEVKAWADMGVKQYKVRKEMATEESRTRESTTAAHQTVGDLDTAAGQVLKELLPFYPGSNQDERCANLWQHIQELYQEKGWPASRRLKKLTSKDIVKPKKPPELDCKAHEVRHFCPLLECLCNAKCLHEGTPHHKAVYKVAKYCSHMYNSLENDNLQELVKAGRKFISQYMALEEAVCNWDENETKLWHSKPKFHLFAHILDLASDGNHHKDSWNYRDETMAGTVQSLSFRRGGKFQPGKATEKILLRWMADTPRLNLRQPAQGSQSSRIRQKPAKALAWHQFH